MALSTPIRTRYIVTLYKNQFKKMILGVSANKGSWFSLEDLMPQGEGIAVLTSEEAAAILKIHPKVLERMAKVGEAPGFKIGKYWRYRVSDLESWISGKVESSRQPCRNDPKF